MKIQPLGDRVLIKRIKNNASEEKLSSGIYIARKDKDEIKNQGIVEAIGPKLQEKKEKGELHFSLGDKVIFSWGESIEIDNETYDLISENNILAVLKEEK